MQTLLSAFSAIPMDFYIHNNPQYIEDTVLLKIVTPDEYTLKEYNYPSSDFACCYRLKSIMDPYADDPGFCSVEYYKKSDLIPFSIPKGIDLEDFIFYFNKIRENSLFFESYLKFKDYVPYNYHKIMDEMNEMAEMADMMNWLNEMAEGGEHGIVVIT